MSIQLVATVSSLPYYYGIALYNFSEQFQVNIRENWLRINTKKKIVGQFGGGPQKFSNYKSAKNK